MPPVFSGRVLEVFFAPLPPFQHGFGPAPLNLRAPDRFRRRAGNDDGRSPPPALLYPFQPGVPVPEIRGSLLRSKWTALPAAHFDRNPLGGGQSTRMTQIWALYRQSGSTALKKQPTDLQQTTSCFEDRTRCSSEIVPFFGGGSFTPPRRALFWDIRAFSLVQRQTRTRPGVVA